MSENDLLSSGHVFGRYRIVRLIGQGGMGAVYEALHPTLKKRVAIKTLLPAHARKDEARARFLREAEAASSINHPNVVNVSDVGMEGELPYMVMELLEGQTLGDLLAARGALPAEQAVGLLLPAIAAVAAGHERGVIHRDLKPHNIFLARGRRGELVPKVLDFGVSKLTGDDNVHLTGTMTVLGTAAYMSPEQARGAKGVDFQSDQYSLGLILFELLTGVRAHPGESALEVLHNVAMGLIKPARELKPDLAADLDAVLARMLATTATNRYPSLHDAGRALLPFADDKTRTSMAAEFVASTTATTSMTRAPTDPSSDPSARSNLGRTRVMPTSAGDSPSDTTLRHAAMEVETVDARRPSRRAWAGIAAALGAAGAVVGIGFAWTSSKGPRTTPPPPTPIVHQDLPRPLPSPTPPEPPVAARPPASAMLVPIRTVPLDAEIFLDDRPPVRGHLDVVLPHDGPSHRLRVSAAGFVSKVIYLRADEPPPPEIELERAPSSGKPSKPVASAAAPVARDRGPAAHAKAPRVPAVAIAPVAPVAPVAVTVAKSSGAVSPERATEPAGAPDATPAAKRGANNSLIIK